MFAVVVDPVHTAQLRNITRQQENIYHYGSISNDDITDSEDRFGVPKIVLCICVLFIILRLQSFS